MGADLWGKILDILCYAMFPGSFDRVTRILGSFYVIGLWGVFVKCGLKGWWALVPVVRTYKLALCADREQEGRTLTVLNIVTLVTYIISRFTAANNLLIFVCAA
ncbi:MAG: hypothetical protein J6Y48_12905, partial [Clostridia bacterium]|nr:hypothetical protein [Clostridia bacterium]